MFEVEFTDGWDEYFSKLDKPCKERVWKRIQKLKGLVRARHLKHGLPFFVLEAGQYRIGYEEILNLRRVCFVGTHKQYEKWYKE
jgi:mRNA-degrading endonuclease RelE of RelBE toxin-antitoxin system